MKFLLTIIPILLFVFPTYSQFDAIITDQIIMEENCEGQILSGKLKIYGPVGDSIKFYNLSSDASEMRFWRKGIEISNSDTLILNNQKDYEIDFSFKFREQEEKFVRYSTEYNRNIILPINTGSYNISNKEIESGKKKIINIKDNCSDSIRVYFPYGGTVSGVTVHANKRKDQFIKSVGYGIGDKNNYVTFGKNEIGNYYIRFAACWWSENFWLEIINE